MHLNMDVDGHALLQRPHADLTSADWKALQNSLAKGGSVQLDGKSLTISDVIGVALYGLKTSISQDPKVADAVQGSVDLLDQQLRAGRTIYGVNTGFGGSADTRTADFARLQIALTQHLNVGILLPSDKGISPEPNELLRSHALPVPVVRAMMLIRCNSLLRGHSGVRLEAMRSILTLLSLDMTPVVPLRGSISASGDLSSLSYLAGAVEGNPDVFIRIGNQADTSKPVEYTTADVALKRAGLQPLLLQAKEGLGITNGTAASCAAGCIAIHQSQQMALLTQLLTAMGTEALLGTAHNYHPFISEARPHQGQAEAASNILAFLAGSQLSPDRGPDACGLAQDRYALRTAPQWIGPQLEDLLLAQRQVATEVNSTTDNPLIDVAGGRIHHGGNFQAMSITSAMEKTMTALQNLGRMMFSQCSELINNVFNKGLPPNLSADDPSLSFTFKGFDVNMAAYMSELAYLAHPVSTHVNITEMNNQSVNSMALVSARYALEAVEVMSLMAATYLYALCQALDLRCLHIEFIKKANPAIANLIKGLVGLEDTSAATAIHDAVWEHLMDRWDHLSHLDLIPRSETAVRETVGSLLTAIVQHASSNSRSLDILTVSQNFQHQAAGILSTIYDQTRAAFFVKPTTPQYLSYASRKIYEYVRIDLRVPLHRGIIDHPTLVGEEERKNGSKTDGTLKGKILGTMASEIYVALRSGELHKRVIESWSHVVSADSNGTFTNGEGTGNGHSLTNGY